MSLSPLRARFRGAILGTAIGDALGMPVEGRSYWTIQTYYRGIRGYEDDHFNPEGLRAGQWTDDTQQMWALLEALCEVCGPDPEVFARALVRAYRSGPRRWGRYSREAVSRLEAGCPPGQSGDPTADTAGALARSAPLGLWWAARRTSPEQAWAQTEAITGVSHAHPEAITGAFLQAWAVCRLALSDPAAFEPETWLEELLKTLEAVGPSAETALFGERVRALWARRHEIPLELTEGLTQVPARARDLGPLALVLFGRVFADPEAVILSGINAGGDTDTLGALLGALCGALHGCACFPQAWLEGLEARSELEAAADRLYEAALQNR
ncbi:MAG: ADP-ribosylglycohydrolase family protein [Bacteroidota bacterium]|nr:ADP-ribosylglycohydrolase family protein [Rhodothermia bacterium]MDW8286268.1 ADP-ribosylglycohydrolase family protein [Bacteroidota bacterium]